MRLLLSVAGTPMGTTRILDLRSTRCTGLRELPAQRTRPPPFSSSSGWSPGASWCSTWLLQRLSAALRLAAARLKNAPTGFDSPTGTDEGTVAGLPLHVLAVAAR